MIEEQPTIPVTPDQLVAEVQALRNENWRLVQIGVTAIGEAFEVNYSFDRELRFRNLRVQVAAAGACLPSVSGVYWCAFLYENEAHDLFGIRFDGLVLDFKGNLYQTATPFPFAGRLETGAAVPAVAPATPVKPTA
ncbi:MAG: NADH-quinone oxidoreductase subunit C [Kiritimatiellia bacterium]